MKMFNKIFVLFLFVGYAISEKIRFDNYKVYEIDVKNEDHVNIFEHFIENDTKYIYLNSPARRDTKTVLMVAPEKVLEFNDLMKSNEFQYKLIDLNIQKLIDDEENLIILRSSIGQFDWETYHKLDDINNWLVKLAVQYPDQITLIKGGISYENRTIYGVKLEYKSNQPGIFIEGGMHAREWISPATVTYILNQLLTSEEKDVRQLAEQFTWYFFPVFNPDGYVYTHEKNRLWRKTRKPYNNGECYGADPNRNWDFHWNEKGASLKPCSEVFAGSSAFSEIEAKSLSEFILSLKGKLNAYISFHAYSQLLLFPYGHTDEYIDNNYDLSEIGRVAAKALAKRYGTKYTVGNIYETIYPASGGSMDWAYDAVNALIAYTYELRPCSRCYTPGFLLGPEEIIPVGEETLDSLVAMMKEARSMGYFST